MKRYNHRTTLTAVLATALLLAACAKSDVISDIKPSIPAGMGELTLGELQLNGNDLPSGGLTPEPAASAAGATPAADAAPAAALGATRASVAGAADTTRATASASAAAATPASAATRATSSALPAGSTLRLYAFEKGKTDFGTKLATRTYTIDAAGTPQLDAGQAPLYLPAGDVDIYLAGPVSHDFGTVDSPQVDQIAAEYGIYPRAGVDLVAAYATSTVTIGRSNPLPTMTLTHKMALVQVVVEAAPNAVFENLALKEVKLFDQPLVGSYTLDSDGGIVTPGTAVSEFVYPLIEEETTKIRFSATTVLMPQSSKEFKIETTFECNQKNMDAGDNHPTLKYRQSGLVQEPLAAATATRFTAQPMIPVEIKWRTKVLPWNDVVQDGITIPGGITPINPVAPPTADQWVEIDGLKWTKGNLVAKNTHQCMVGDPSDYGVYFQFGSLVGWTGGADGNGTGQGSQTADKRVWPIEMGRTKPAYNWQNYNVANIGTLKHYYFNYSANGWGTNGRDLRDFDEAIDGDAGTGTLASGRYAKQGVGDPCTYYLGDPWRLPTQVEIFALKERGYGGWQQYVGANGRWFGPGNATGNAATAIFLPAAGHRYPSSSNNWEIGGEGRYGTTTIVSATQHNYVYISSGTVNSPDKVSRSGGLTARCVSGTYVKPANPVTPPTQDQWVEIDGLKWTKGNLVATSSTASNVNGCKVGAPEDGGLYFQFGSLIGWKGGATANGGTGVGSNPNTGLGTQWWNGATSFSWDNEAMVWPVAMAGTPSAWPQATSGTAHQWYFSGNGVTSGTMNETDPIKGVGDPCTYYLGDSWRMPTAAEYKVLFDNVENKTSWSSVANWSWVTSPYNGAQHKSASLYFPASGTRYDSSGAFGYVTAHGYYWSSSVTGATYGSSLSFSSSNVYPQGNNIRFEAFPVRCVSGTYVKPANPVTPPTQDQWVEIDGLKWTKGNLVATSSTASNVNGCKVGAPEDGGLYFQFGSLIGWKGGATANSGTGQGTPSYTSNYWGGAGSWSWSNDAMVWPVAMAGTPSAWPQATSGTDHQWHFSGDGVSSGTMNVTDPTKGVGDPCTYYLGDKWRLPTAAEYKVLFDNVENNTSWSSVANWSWVTSPYNGAQHKSASLYFPASGSRFYSSGAFSYVTTDGYYWSSSIFNAVNGYYLRFDNSNVNPQSNTYRSAGYPVRCVSGTYVAPPDHPVNPPTANDYVEINGLYWTKGNLVATSSTASNMNGCKVGAPEDGGLYFQFGSLIGWKGGATANGGTGVGESPNTGSGVQWWGGATAWSWSNDAMVWPSSMASTPAAWSTNASQATEANAFQKWFFDFSGTSGGVNYSTGFSDIRDYTHPTLGALKEGKMASLGVGDPCTYYLGDPWRLPTAAEYKVLFDNVENNTSWSSVANWSWVTSPYNGAQRTGNSLYFPASGIREGSNGAFYNVTMSGFYWSSLVNSATSGYILYFTSSRVDPQDYNGRSYGFPARCVSTAP